MRSFASHLQAILGRSSITGGRSSRFNPLALRHEKVLGHRGPLWFRISEALGRRIASTRSIPVSSVGMRRSNQSDVWSRKAVLPSCRGFSFVELLTVVAMIAILASAAVPVASSLYRRNRENSLRETLLIFRMAIRDFPRNNADDDDDGKIDEDPRGDFNTDGYPGLRGVEDSVRGVDVDGAGQTVLLANGFLNLLFDTRFRADDDEDGLIDEEAFATDLNDLTQKMGILRGRVPVDATTGESSWRVILARVNNDADWVDSGYDTGSDSPPTSIVLGPPDRTGLSPREITRVLRPAGVSPVGLDPTSFKPYIDEDPRDGIDNDGDGRTDEDPPDVIDVRSWNSSESSDGTRYSDW